MKPVLLILCVAVAIVLRCMRCSSWGSFDPRLASEGRGL